MIVVDDKDKSLAELLTVAEGRVEVGLSGDDRWLDTMARSRSLLERALAREEAVYGVSTGVGHSASKMVQADDRDDFATRIVQHHGCGVGQPFSEVQVRGIIFARLVSLAKGYSAVRVSFLQAAADLLNRGVVPYVPRLGSVGASGDLTPLSYIAAVLLGERRAWFEGELLPSTEALQAAGLAPFSVVAKETLAWMNGTSVMTAVGALAAAGLKRVLRWAERSTALAGEVLHCRSGAFHPLAHRIKPHPGQVKSAAKIRSYIEGSALVDRDIAGRIVQDPYSIRCAPQVLGAARDALTWVEELLTRELNSVNDNPLVDPASGDILFAGNFYGGHVALGMDLLKTTAASVADLLDRQFALLLDSRSNIGLPDTLVDYGGNGVKGLQITTSALAALLAQRSSSDTVQSRPTEVNNQDKVSMGLNASLNAAESVSLLQSLLATHMIAVSNAASLRDEAQLSPTGKELTRIIREYSQVLIKDRPLDHDIDDLTALVQAPTPPDLFE